MYITMRVFSTGRMSPWSTGIRSRAYVASMNDHMKCLESDVYFNETVMAVIPLE